MGKTKGFLLAVAAMLFAFSCSDGDKEEGCDEGGGFVATCSADFRTVEIGSQIWMAENLNCNVAGSRCYDNLESNCDIYGRMYDWATAMTVCPEGWHLPSKEEWDAITDYIGDEYTDAKKLKATSGWNQDSNGTDDYGFAALPGGFIHTTWILFSDTVSSGVGDFGAWWTTSQDDLNLKTGYYESAYTRFMYTHNNTVWWSNFKNNWFSVRCVQGSLQSSSSSFMRIKHNNADIDYNAIGKVRLFFF